MNVFTTKYGHFSNDGNEYIINTPQTPKPWINVISNGDYGVVISQTGGGFSWLTHSEFNRVTRWHQDLIQDNWGKYIYVKNNETGELWSPTWLPVKTELDFYECHHGIGYTIFTTEFKGIKIQLTIFVPVDDSLEIWDLKVTNSSAKPVDLSFYTYFEWCLGSSADHHREFHKTFIETKFDKKLNSIISGKRIWEIPFSDRGHWNIDYEYKGFFACNKKVSSYECDKENFLGQYGSLISPEAIVKNKLTKTTGIWYDPIACLKVDVKLNENEEDRFAFYLGLKKNEDEIEQTLKKYKSSKQIDKALENVKVKWEEMLSTLEINTPDDAMNLMVNKWLRYQAISGRLWARTAYYQQSGAYGFRDQLQDSLVFLPIDPSLTEKQIKLHAQHQFKDGTVLHWWHPITETGLATKMTDDLLWLPFLIIQYLDETNNYSFLNQIVPYYDDKEKEDDLFEHCKRAINRVLKRFSKRGLPLIGAGDWNDGLSAVGLEMKGESVWLAEFLYYILINFKKVAEARGRKRLAERYSERAKELKKAFEKHSWDGDWFWRATKDSGEKIGSAENKEGRIYLNSQSWSVISGITTDERKHTAMDAVKNHLVKDNGPVLLYPAYTKPDKYIGYLTRYAAGRRENGGVYMHAATWAIWAYSLLKRSEDAYDIFKRICPIYNGMKPDKWKAEPYVTPGNIEGPESVFYGMAGWTWYTGSASWYQKVCVDWILGIRATKEGLLVDPCIPKEWNKYSVKRKFRNTIYNIKVINPDNVSYGVKSIIIDGEVAESNLIKAVNKKEVNVEVILG
ncbi:MAG: glycosyl transferase family 36 [Ignavibacteriales bacterium]|nr:glycosyl transferase family 36 [Ignavibacteriales bacterium]